MGSWTAGARAPCRRGRAGPGCSVSVSTPPSCTASPLTWAAGPPSRPSQPLGRPPVQSPLRGCTDTLPAACPQHQATTPFLCNCYRPLWPHSEQLVYTAAERGPWTTLFRSWILLASNPRSANAVQPSGSSQPCTVSPRCSSRTGQRAAGRGRALREPRFLCPSPSRGLLLALQTPCRRALPRGGALAWPARHPLCTSSLPRCLRVGHQRPEFGTGLSLWAPALAPPQRKASSLREQRPRCSLPPGPGTKEALCNPQMTE